MSNHLCQTLPPCVLHRPGSEEYKNVPGAAGIIGKYSFFFFLNSRKMLVTASTSSNYSEQLRALASSYQT
jgi:hypothetical protein